LERKIVWAEAQIWGRRGEICAFGAPNDFSRSSETPNTPTHYSEEPKRRVIALIKHSDVYDPVDKLRPRNLGTHRERVSKTKLLLVKKDNAPLGSPPRRKRLGDAIGSPLSQG